MGLDQQDATLYRQSMDGTVFRILHRDVGLFETLSELEDLDLRILRIQNRGSLYSRLGNRAV
jgi:hypothetical protein